MYTEWVDRVQELVKGGFFNDDIQSINLYQGQDLFTAKKAAIVTSVQPQITSFYRTMGGADTVGDALAGVRHGNSPTHLARQRRCCC